MMMMMMMMRLIGIERYLFGVKGHSRFIFSRRDYVCNCLVVFQSGWLCGSTSR